MNPRERYQSAVEMLKDIEEFKKNPSVHFEYKYFVDENPTKFVDAINQVKGQEPEEEEVEKKSSLIPVLSGIAAAFVLVVIVGVFIVLIQAGILFPNTNGMVATPNLVGQNINTAQVKYSKDFTIIIDTPEDSSQYAKDVIMWQSPTTSIKSKKHGTIHVKVSNGPRIVQVDDVYGQEASQAAAILQNKGFTVTQQKMFDSNTPIGYVVKSSPSRFTNVAINSTVVIWVSSVSSSSSDSVQVKDYTGKLITDVAAQLATDKLTMGTKTEKADASPKGTILEQSLTVNSNVASNTTINFTVSTGVAPPKSSSITIDLSKFTNLGDSVTVSIFNIDTNDQIISKEYSTALSKTFTLSGNDTINYSVLINNKLYRNYFIDYTQSPPAVTPGIEHMEIFTSSSSTAH